MISEHTNNDDNVVDDDYLKFQLMRNSDTKLHSTKYVVFGWQRIFIEMPTYNNIFDIFLHVFCCCVRLFIPIERIA